MQTRNIFQDKIIHLTGLPFFTDLDMFWLCFVDLFVCYCAVAAVELFSFARKVTVNSLMRHTLKSERSYCEQFNETYTEKLIKK